ncbi:Gp37-like protein [Nonomuraea sp. ZG12]|uniref:Gp37-like protein n=1 Tax=Nonomuraea sp. ZG12 TaxID=3452207 RepID=UPI003F8984EE
MDANFKIYVRESLFPRDTSIPPLAIVSALDAYTSFDAIVRHNDVGSWTLVLPAEHPQARLLQPGRGIVVLREGNSSPVISGPIRKITRTWDDSSDSGAGSITVTGVDDNVFLAERLALPAPQNDIHLQGAAQLWKADLAWRNAGELLYHLLKENTQGHSSRAFQPLFLAPPSEDLLADESTKSVRLKFDRIDELVALLSSVYNMSVRCVWHPDPKAAGGDNGEPSAAGPGLLVTFEPIRDMTGTARFSADQGNLRGYTYSTDAPDATRLVIGTQNRTWHEATHEPTYDELGNVTGYTVNMAEKQGPERWFGYYINRFRDPWWWGDPASTPAEFQDTLQWAQQGFSATEVEWGMSTERYKDRRDIPWQWAQDPYQQTGWQLDPPTWSPHYRALMDEVESFNLESGPKGSIKVHPIETPRLRYHLDYGIGDRVSVNVDEVDQVEQVNEVRLSATAQAGPEVHLTIGASSATETPYLYRSIRDLWKSLNNLWTREALSQPLDTIPPAPFVLRKVV